VNRINLSFLFILISISLYAQSIFDKEGAIIRSDTLKKNIYLCFTGHDHIEGFEYVLNVLNKQKVKGSFFFTGDFVRNNEALVQGNCKKRTLCGSSFGQTSLVL